MPRETLTEAERRFLDATRVARLASIGPDGAPHLVPVCFALDGANLYVPIDEKPKRPGARLQRLANLAARPAAAVTVDRYAEDWRRLGWVMLRGNAEILAAGTEHDRAQALARTRYPQLGAMRLDDLPVIALRIARVASWGDLSPD
ncbi:MAG: TIGR03668 family PPOX class F420-dependent oxidoreductase [Rhodospirillales bacterium]|nr:TIGR03668 family PPOX class F420-dependent oxidoreductase [Rhodospirillales bacterium]